MNFSNINFKKISHFVLNTILFTGLVYIASIIPLFIKQHFSEVSNNTAHADTPHTEASDGFDSDSGSDGSCDGDQADSSDDCGPI
jgi:hypothetical protein